MRISEFRVDRYGPLSGVRSECTDGIEVFHGPNESGKTLLVDALLKLLAPGVDSQYSHIGRVEESPSGYVVLETADGETKLGDGTTLPDVSPVRARHLRNVFTVRDNDLALRDHHDFYNSLTEQLGDLHTSEIAAIREAFEDRGRLTTERRNLSNSAPHDHPKEVRDGAARLAEEIAAYVEEAEAEDLDATERELLRTERQLRACRADLETQKRAETAAEYERLAERLSTFREAAEALEERQDVSREELQTLNTLSNRASEAEADVEAAEAELESLRGEVADLEAERRATADELRTLERRAEAVTAVESRLETFREERGGTADGGGKGDGSRWGKTTAALAVAGVGLGGVSTVAGALGGGAVVLALAAVLVGVGVLSAGGWLYARRRAASAAEERTALLAAARDAGLRVESVADVGPAIRSFRDEVESLEARIDDVETEIDLAERRMGDHEDDLEAARERRESALEERREILRRAGVEDADAYRDALEETEDLETERSRARQSLVEAIGDPGPDAESAATHWERELAEMVEDVEIEDVDAEVYDPAELKRLRDREAELEERKEGLERTLAEHERQIRGFAERARELRTEPFVDSRPALAAETVDGLAQLRRDLEAVVDRIERDAEVSRVGLACFDEIHTEEERKISDLFEADGRAAAVFGRLTGERYADVSYDTESRQLVVEDRDGEEYTPAELSQATREQLYFATRVSLSERLLGSEPGFFILDDAFLPADPSRLEAGFELLQSLVDDGWQVIYLTAKREVGRGMVETFGLPRTELEPLP